MPTITEPGSPSTHRFLDFFKFGRYAFARGLAVAPMHLPIALQAMEDEGWELLAIFGETETQSIGFIFRRHADA